MDNQTNQPQEQPQTVIDIVWLVKYMLSKLRFIGYSVAATLIVSMVIYICTPAKFTASTAILPVTESEGVGGNLSALASFTGINMGKGSKNLITPELYPEVAQSTPFMQKLMDVKLHWNDRDTMVSTYDYMRTRVPSFGEYLYAYTIGLPGTIKAKMEPDEQSVLVSNPLDSARVGYIVLDKWQRSAMHDLSEKISVSSSRKTDIVTVEVEGESPMQAAQLASQTIEMLQTTIIDYKTARAKLSLDFIEDRYKHTQAEYERVRNAFFKYKDSHRDMIDERVDAEYQRLSDEYQTSYSVLKNLATQMEQSKLELMEKTPVFSVVEPVVMPKHKSSPMLAIHLFAGVFFGLVLSVGYLFVRITLLQMFAPEKLASEQQK